MEWRFDLVAVEVGIIFISSFDSSFPQGFAAQIVEGEKKRYEGRCELSP